MADHDLTEIIALNPFLAGVTLPDGRPLELNPAQQDMVERTFTEWIVASSNEFAKGVVEAIHPTEPAPWMHYSRWAPVPSASGGWNVMSTQYGTLPPEPFCFKKDEYALALRRSDELNAEEQARIIERKETS